VKRWLPVLAAIALAAAGPSTQRFETTHGLRVPLQGARMVKLAAGGPTFTFGQWWTMSGNSHATKLPMAIRSS
jgi:hypothetical protein